MMQQLRDNCNYIYTVYIYIHFQLVLKYFWTISILIYTVYNKCNDGFSYFRVECLHLIKTVKQIKDMLTCFLDSVM